MRRIVNDDLYVTLSERELKTLILKAAYGMGWAVYHVPMTNVRGSQGRGYPDLTLARDGEKLWLELKTKEGQLSPEQRVWHEALRPHAYVIRPIDWYMGRVHELLA